MLGRIDDEFIADGQDLARDGIDLGDTVDLVPEEFDTEDVFFPGRNDLDRIPRTRKRPRARSTSLRSYWTSMRRRSNASRGIMEPTSSPVAPLRYSDGRPSPYMQDTEATTMVSRASSSDRVAECLSLSISSLMLAVFSM